MLCPAARSSPPVPGYQLYRQMDTLFGAQSLMCGRINDQTLAELAALCNGSLECAGFSVFEESNSAGLLLPVFCLKANSEPLESRATSTMPSLAHGFFARSEC